MANTAGNYGSPIFMAASGIVKADQGSLLGFLCSTSGTLDLYDDTKASANHFIQALAVTAGTFYPIPAGYGTSLFAALTGGAQGTFFVG